MVRSDDPESFVLWFVLPRAFFFTSTDAYGVLKQGSSIGGPQVGVLNLLCPGARALARAPFVFVVFYATLPRR